MQTTNKKESEEANGTTTISLPEDIVLHILASLPVQSNTRFKCVCKRWCSIIDDPFFIDVHLNRSQNRPDGGQILISFASGSRHYFYSTSLFGGKAVQHLWLRGCTEREFKQYRRVVSESLNGLVCFFNGQKAFVVNLATRRAIALCESLETHQDVWSKYYFGFDSSTKEYKVLHIFEPRWELGDVKCEVCMIKSDSKPYPWRKITHFLPYPYEVRGKGVCINGSIHLLGIGAQGEQALVAFGVATEEFRATPLPDSIPTYSALTQIGGRLALLSQKNQDFFDFEMWVLEDYDKFLWVRKSDLYSRITPICVGTNYSGDMLLTSSTKVPNQCDIIPYDDHKNRGGRTITMDGLPFEMDINDGVSIEYYNFSVTNYVESFVPLTGD